MGMLEKYEKVAAVRKHIFDIPDFIDTIPERGAALWAFRTYVGQALRLLWREPEIALFAAAQWIAVVLVYVTWAWGIRHIDLPAELDWLGTLLEAAWSIACLAIVAVPVAFLTACIGMVHFLRQEGRPSTLFACMGRVAPRMRPLWTFTLIDVGITAGQWFNRIPSRRRSRPVAALATGEALYYAWKVATVGMLPALLADRTLLQAANESVDLVKRRLAEAMLLRSGYTLSAWLVGLAALGVAWWQLRAHRAALPDFEGAAFWFWAPAVIAIGVVQLFLRPVFILASSELYHRYRHEADEAQPRDFS